MSKKKIQCGYCKTKFDKKDMEIWTEGSQDEGQDTEVDLFACPKCKLRTILHVRRY